MRAQTVRLVTAVMPGRRHAPCVPPARMQAWRAHPPAPSVHLARTPTLRAAPNACTALSDNKSRTERSAARRAPLVKLAPAQQLNVVPTLTAAMPRCHMKTLWPPTASTIRAHTRARRRARRGSFRTARVRFAQTACHLRSASCARTASTRPLGRCGHRIRQTQAACARRVTSCARSRRARSPRC